MGRIFEIQAKNIDTFRRKKRRKLRKGDVIRIYGDLPLGTIREALDLRPQTKDVLSSKKYRNKAGIEGTLTTIEIGSSPGGVGGNWPSVGGGSSASPEAQAVLDRMTGLTETETSAIIALVDAEVAASNWGLIDEFFSLSLSGANALKGFKTKTATAVNAPVHSINGYDFNGTTQYINTNFIPF